MSSKTKIVVLRMKEIIYTAIFIGLGILLILLLLVMFRPKKESSAAPASAQYIPGVYEPVNQFFRFELIGKSYILVFVVLDRKSVV